MGRKQAKSWRKVHSLNSTLALCTYIHVKNPHLADGNITVKVRCFTATTNEQQSKTALMVASWRVHLTSVENILTDLLTCPTIIIYFSPTEQYAGRLKRSFTFYVKFVEWECTMETGNVQVQYQDKALVISLSAYKIQRSDVKSAWYSIRIRCIWSIR